MALMLTIATEHHTILGKNLPVAVFRTTFVGLYATGSLGGPGDAVV